MLNYFLLYDLPQSFHPDPAKVKSKFYELSRRYHPDHFAGADAATGGESLRMAAVNNDAYKTLNNSDATMAYILKLNELLEDEEKYNLPPAFLMEMMDLNEAVSEYEMDRDNQAVKTQALQALQKQLDAWISGIEPLTHQYDNGVQTKEMLLKIKDYYFRRKYLLRIQGRINNFAPRH
ncbi:MAG: iron-sulfur cluster co-chaperone HscB C-terminal domain-containing protein [Bacteroidota bacterium]